MMIKMSLSKFKHEGKLSFPKIGEFILKEYNNTYHFRMIKDNKQIWRYNPDEGIYQALDL
jgi:hypothetical protein